MSISIDGDDFNAPTNPYLIDSLGGASTGHRVYAAIATHGEVSVSISGWVSGSSITENQNLNATKGFRIKCYDSLTTTGVRFNPSTSDLNANDYFVLLYSDKPLQHHLAKITEVLTEDEYGDAFEFEPRLGNEIPKDTKFVIFTMTKNADVVAVSMGMKQDDDLGSSSNNFEGELVRRLPVSRPLFYFYNNLLDKQNQLDHNTKYMVLREVNDGSSANGATLTKADDSLPFTTVQDFGKKIIDYSKFSHSITMTDKLRDLDDDATNSVSNEGSPASFNHTLSGPTDDYSGKFINARREGTDLINSTALDMRYTGPKRYLHYDFSPTKSNLLYNVYDHTNTESIDGKGGFAETSIVDNGRIMSRKIKEFDAYRVRHLIHRGGLNDFFPLKATLNSISGSTLIFNTEYELADFLNDGDEIKVDNKIFIFSGAGVLSGNTQTVGLKNDSVNPFVRTEDEGIFTAQATTLTTDSTLQRRAYNAKDKTLMLDISLLNNRFSKIYVAFTSLNHNERFATITACDATKGLLTLSFDDDSYTYNALSFAKGQYQIFIERFNGEVENTENKKENGQTIMEIQGRDKFNKLLSPIVNQNTLFSEDIIYSTNSPYNKLSQIDSTNFSIALGATTLATGVAVADFDIVPTTGDKIFTAFGYIGEITSTSGDPLTINFTKALTRAVSEKIYIDTEKNYVLSKALGASHLATDKPTSLTGAANKGLIFTSGNKINISTGAEDETLVSTSANTNEGAVGYAINKPSSVSKDSAFQCLLKDEHGSAGSSTFDTVNTLIDFEVVSTATKDNITEIELAPYMPITLGRYVEYHFNKDEYVFTEVATVSTVSGTLSGSSKKDHQFITDSSTAYTLKKDNPLFVGDSKTFVGKVSNLIIESVSGTTLIEVYLDRSNFIFTVGDKVYTANIPTHNIATVNSAHLWGGKIISTIHPLSDTTFGTLPLDIEDTNGLTSYTRKYGSSLYKPTFSAFGNFDLNIERIFVTIGSFHFPIKKFYPNPSSLSQLMGAYHLRPNIGSNNYVSWDTPAITTYRTLFPENRGQTSTFGSNSTDTRIHDTNERSAYLPPSTNFSNRKYFSQDESALRLFLYVNSDLLPYSSKRKDSLFDGNKTLNNYNLFLTDGKEVADVSVGAGKIKKLKDSNFQTLNFSSDKDVSSLKRFGMMRLTEVCYDMFFNLVNPEKPIRKFVERQFSAANQNFTASVLSANINGISGTTITFDGTITPDLTNGDRIHDENGQFIGLVDTKTSTTEYELQAAGFLTNAGSHATRAYHVTLGNLDLNGRNKVDSFDLIDDDDVHPLKVAITPKGTAYKSGLPANSEIVLPTVFKTSAALTAASGGIQQMIADFINSTKAGTYKNMRGVVLDRFSIEDGGKYPVHVGATTHPFNGIDRFTNMVTIDSNNYDGMILESARHFKQHDDITAFNGATSNFESTAVDGAYMVFKPILRLDAGNNMSANATITSSNGNVHHATIDTTQSDDENSFLRFVDLTGCYLVPEAGVREGITFAKNLNYRTMNDMQPSELIYIISHEPDDNDSLINKHHLITDVQLTDSTNYRILQPNETFSYDFFPETVRLNTLSHKFTKVSNGNTVYDINQSYILKETQNLNANSNTNDEGVLSMFVAIDLDKQSTDTGVVIKDKDKFFESILQEGSYNLHFSDGKNGKKLGVEVNGDDELILSEQMNLKGVVSVSETFAVSSRETLKINPTRACIGSTVSLGLEGEDLINELLEQEEIEFTTTSTDTPMYLAPNYQGIDLYSAIRYILNRKDMKLVEENDIFKIFPEDEDSLRTNIVIDDSGDFLIMEFSKITTLFDFFNEIIVYGDTHKAVRKDLRSIKKRGRKTLEVVENTLLTQEEVDKRATKLLRIHSRLNQKLSFTMQNKGINQLRVGDIVNVSIPRENIPMNEFIVLEMEHQLTGFIKLELGRYSKDLSDIFSELLISSKETKAALRSNELQTNEISFNFLDTLNTKELKLLVRKRDATGASRTLGFIMEFGFSTNSEFGFTGGAITITDLVEEDLA